MPRLKGPPLPNPIQNPNPPIINPSFIPHRPIFNPNPRSIYQVHHVLNPNYKNECREYKFFSKVFAEDSVKITNYYEKNCESGEFSCLVCAGLGQKVGKMLDRALIRTGRMDKHILMSYCSFEVFKVLANKYLNIRFNELFVRIEQLLGEVAVTPAQVVEYLIPKSPEDDGERCLYGLVCALENAKVALREHLAAQEAPQEHGGGLNFCLGPV